MTKFRSQLWTDPKGKRFVVLPEADFIRMSELIEDRGLSRIFKESIQSDTTEPSIPLAEVKRQLSAQGRAATRKRKS